jgi:hypothetical protein
VEEGDALSGRFRSGAGPKSDTNLLSPSRRDTGDAEWTPDVGERGAVGQALLDGVLCVAGPGGLVYTDAGGALARATVGACDQRSY